MCNFFLFCQVILIILHFPSLFQRNWIQCSLYYELFSYVKKVYLFCCQIWVLEMCYLLQRISVGSCTTWLVCGFSLSLFYLHASIYKRNLQSSPFLLLPISCTILWQRIQDWRFCICVVCERGENGPNYNTNFVAQDILIRNSIPIRALRDYGEHRTKNMHRIFNTTLKV